jgi:hypothetical protein
MASRHFLKVFAEALRFGNILQAQKGDYLFVPSLHPCDQLKGVSLVHIHARRARRGFALSEDQSHS